MYAGSAMAFSSPVGPLLVDKEATLVLTEVEFSWFSSSISLGALLGSVVSAYLMSTFGRRGTMMISSLPCTAGWILMGKYLISLLY